MNNYFGIKNFSVIFNLFLLLIVLSIWSYIVFSFFNNTETEDYTASAGKNVPVYPPGLVAIGNSWVSRALYVDSLIKNDSLSVIIQYGAFDPFFHTNESRVEPVYTPPAPVFIDSYTFKLLGLVQDSLAATAFFQVKHILKSQSDSTSQAPKHSSVASFLLQLSTLAQKKSRSSKNLPDHIISFNDSLISIRYKSIEYRIPYTIR